METTVLFGEIAAVLTAVCWSFGSLLFTAAGRRIGSVAVNQIRLWFALGLLLLIHFFVFGVPFPVDAGKSAFFWLGLSGFVGYVLGDSMLFESFVLIGARLAMLLMTLVPIFSSILGYFFLGESMNSVEIFAVFVTVAAIGWVVAEPKAEDAKPHPHYVLGVLMGVGGAMGQALGLLFAKNGLTGGFSPISANLIRVFVAAMAIGLISVFRGKFSGYFRGLKQRSVLAQLLGASFLGPVLGVVLSLAAIAYTRIGIASTLMSLSPLFLIPLSGIFFKEHISIRAIAGTVIAFAASALLFFY